MKEFIVLANLFIICAVFGTISSAIRFILNGMNEYPVIAISLGSFMAFIAFYDLRKTVLKGE